MQLNTYLQFNGDCEAALNFYAEVLGGTVVAMLRYEGMPGPEQPPEMRDKIMHGRITAGTQVLMGSDSPPGHYRPPQGFTVTINVDDPAEAERIYTALSQGGQVQMAIQETFWARRFAMFADRYGTPWMINCEKPHG